MKHVLYTLYIIIIIVAVEIITNRLISPISISPRLNIGGIKYVVKYYITIINNLL